MLLHPGTPRGVSGRIATCMTASETSFGLGVMSPSMREEHSQELQPAPQGVCHDEEEVARTNQAAAGMANHPEEVPEE